jgi:hypothetical protein
MVTAHRGRIHGVTGEVLRSPSSAPTARTTPTCWKGPMTQVVTLYMSSALERRGRLRLKASPTRPQDQRSRCLRKSRMVAGDAP